MWKCKCLQLSTRGGRSDELGQQFGQIPSEACTPLKINLLNGTALKVSLWLISFFTHKVLMGREMENHIDAQLQSTILPSWPHLSRSVLSFSLGHALAHWTWLQRYCHKLVQPPPSASFSSANIPRHTSKENYCGGTLVAKAVSTFAKLSSDSSRANSPIYQTFFLLVSLGLSIKRTNFSNWVLLLGILSIAINCSSEE